MQDLIFDLTRHTHAQKVLMFQTGQDRHTPEQRTLGNPRGFFHHFHSARRVKRGAVNAPFAGALNCLGDDARDIVKLHVEKYLRPQGTERGHESAPIF